MTPLAFSKLCVLCYMCHHTMCPHTAGAFAKLFVMPCQRLVGRRTMCVLILLYMCPRTTTYVSAYYFSCVLILLHMCPHASIYVSSYYYMQGPFRNFACCQGLCPHTTICVLILLHVSSYCYMQGPFRNFACCQRLVGRRAVTQVLNLLALLV